MIRPLSDSNNQIPLYQIVLKKKGDIYEGWVDNILVFKDANKERLLKILDEWCKEQLKKIKEA